MTNTTTEKFIVITGANGGVGFGLAQRIAAYCNDDSAVGVTVLVFACRSASKARQAMAQLETRYPQAFRSNRLQLHLLSIDLCSPSSVVQACRDYRQRFPRVDILFCNAGVLLIDGVDWANVPRSLMRDPLRFFTDVSSTLRQRRNLRIDGHEELGQVFTANVLSHYVMLRELESHLRLSPTGGRVIWTGSQTSDYAMFSWTDLQGLNSSTPYESSKVAMEILCQLLNQDYSRRGVNIQSFIADPGVVSTSIVSGALTMFINYFAVIPFLYLARIVLDSVVFTPWIGALSLFYLSNLQSAGEFNIRMTTINDASKATGMSDFKYSSRERFIVGQEYVRVAPVDKEIIKESSRGEMLMELEKLRLSHFSS